MVHIRQYLDYVMLFLNIKLNITVHTLTQNHVKREDGWIIGFFATYDKNDDNGNFIEQNLNKNS